MAIISGTRLDEIGLGLVESVGREGGPMAAGWQPAVGNLIENRWLEEAYRGLRFTGMCVRDRGVRFLRIRDFKQYYFNV